MNYFGESAKTTPPSVFFPVFVRFIKAYKVRTPNRCCLCIFPHLCTDGVQLSLLEVSLVLDLRVSVRAEQGRALAASVPQDVAYIPRPNNRKGQLGLTLELQLWCLDWFFPTPRLPLLPSSSLPPDSLALPHHTAHFLGLF